ncbi:hypothetical protein [Hyphococcus sp.]|uniref:hypothetical protein n=1 Tax=Hyphococcus sp. TaxID=2038636 RepID=UPI003CCC1D3F
MTGQSTDYWWSGPICGLGNRLIAIAALKACVGARRIYFPWSNDPSCPGAFDDIFQPDPNLIPAPAPPAGAVVLKTHGWEPLTIHRQLKEALKLSLSREAFCRKFVMALRGLAFRDDILISVRSWREKCPEALVGVHLRRTDRVKHHRDQFRAFLLRKQGLNRELPAALSALYGLAPDAFVRKYENASITRALKRFHTREGESRYAVFTDDPAEGADFVRILKKCGKVYAPEATAAIERPNSTMRSTDIKSALVDLLRLSRCDAIAQGNRASTFSIAAAIIGTREILTPEPLYPFWRVVTAETGRPANGPALK